MRTIILLLILLYADYSFSQQASVPEVQLSTPFIYTKQNLNNKNTIESDVKMKGSQIYSMTTNQVTAALTEVNRFNQQLESLKSIQTNRLNKLPNLSDISDLPKLRELIADKTESKRGLQDRFEKNIKEQVSTRGLYLVILPAGAGCENCGDIKSGEYPLIAQKALASKAIKELMGTLISSVTEVTSKNDVSQRIESQVEGEMTLEQQLDDILQLPKGRRIFLLAVKVGNQTGKGFKENIGGNSDVLKPIEIVACEQSDVLIKTFKKLSIDASTVEKLNQKINEVLPSINEQNKDNKNTIQTLWNDYNSSVDQLAKQTEEEILKEKQKTQKLNSYIANFYPDGIVASDLYDSIKKLTTQISKIEQVINDTIRILASQKIFHPNQRKFSISSNQTQNEAITVALIEESKQIESELSTSTAYTEITTVYNKQTEDVKKAQITYIYGSINQLWAYIIPNDDELILHLFVRRDVSKSQETSPKSADMSPIENFEDLSVADIKNDIIGYFDFSFYEEVQNSDISKVYFSKYSANFYLENELIYCDYSQEGNIGIPWFNLNCVVKIDGSNLNLYFQRDYEESGYGDFKVGDFVAKFSYKDKNTIVSENGETWSRTETQPDTIQDEIGIYTTQSRSIKITEDKDSILIEEYIINSIMANYKDNTTKMEVENSENLLTISFYNIPTKDNDFNGLLSAIYVPIMQKDYIYGDLNNDGAADMIASISVEGGGNSYWNDIFVFLAQEGKYVLSSVTTSTENCGCVSGNFYPDKIQDGIILGESICWAEKDSHCCPSLNYLTTAEFDGKKIKFKNKTMKK